MTRLPIMLRQTATFSVPSPALRVLHEVCSLRGTSDKGRSRKRLFTMRPAEAQSGHNGPKAHLEDEQDFFKDVASGKLAPVASLSPKVRTMNTPAMPIWSRVSSTWRNSSPQCRRAQFGRLRHHHHIRREWRPLGSRGSSSAQRRLGCWRARSYDHCLAIRAAGRDRQHRIRNRFHPEVDRAALQSRPACFAR